MDVDRSDINEALDTIGMHSNHTFHTPDYDSGGKYLRDNCYFIDVSTCSPIYDYDKNRKLETIQDMCIGAIFLCDGGIPIRIQLSPDQVRIPLTFLTSTEK